MHETILITGKDAKTRALMRQALERAGYVTAEAGDGQEALAVLRFMQFDLLITDPAMPSRDALKMLETLRFERMAPQVLALAELQNRYEDQSLLDTVRAVLTQAQAAEVVSRK